MQNRLRFGALFLALSLLVGALSACGKTNHPKATLTLEDGSEVLIYLYPENAPNTVANFISLANDGFYDGLTFHRVVDGFIVQGGDPKGDGTGGPGYTIDGEFSDNGYSKNDIKMEAGVIAMARFSSTGAADTEAAYNSAGSQFFILLEDKDDLQGQYAAFGKVFSGLNTLQKLAQSDTDANDKPRKEILIKSIRVDTYGKDYGEPKVTVSDDAGTAGASAAQSAES